MAITSKGYAGTMSAADVAEWVPRVGQSRYGVEASGDWRVSAAAGTRTVQIAAGRGWGHGVVDEASAPTLLTLDPAVSGVRWWLIVAHREWATGVTDFHAVDAGATAAVPSRDTAPGERDDQPLALVRVGTGDAIAEIRDLRVLTGDGGLLGFDDLAASYLTRPGTVLRIGNIEWRRYLDALATPAWERRDVTPDTGWVNGDRNGGWEWGFFKVKRVGPTVWGRLSAIRGMGWSAGNAIGTLPVGFRPEDETWAVNLWGGGGRGFDIKPSGLITADMDSVGNTGVTLAFTFPAKN